MPDQAGILPKRVVRLRRLALACYLALLALTVLWEGWLAPVPNSPPGFWLAVKSIPLLLPLFGLLHGKPRSYAWASLLLMLYLTEGLVLLWTERHLGFARGSALPWALLETLLSVTFIVAGALYIRGRAMSDQAPSAPG
jgi:uncharacterized membrane protein